MKIPEQFFPESWAKLWQNVLSPNVQERLEKFLDPDADADDF